MSDFAKHAGAIYARNMAISGGNLTIKESKVNAKGGKGSGLLSWSGNWDPKKLRVVRPNRPLQF